MTPTRAVLLALLTGVAGFLAGRFVDDGGRGPAGPPPPARESAPMTAPSEMGPADPGAPPPGSAPGEGSGTPQAPPIAGAETAAAEAVKAQLFPKPVDYAALRAKLEASDLPPDLKASAIRKVDIREKVGEVAPPGQFETLGLVKPSYLGEIRGTGTGIVLDSAGWARHLASEHSLVDQDRDALEREFWEYEEELTLLEKRILEIGFEIAWEKAMNRKPPAALAWYRIGGHLILVEASDDPRLAELADAREAVIRRRTEWLSAFLRDRGR